MNNIPASIFFVQPTTKMKQIFLYLFYRSSSSWCYKLVIELYITYDDNTKPKDIFPFSPILSFISVENGELKIIQS